MWFDSQWWELGLAGGDDALQLGLEHHDKAHEHILQPDARVLAEQLHDPPERRFLLFAVIWISTRSSLRATPR